MIVTIIINLISWLFTIYCYIIKFDDWLCGSIFCIFIVSSLLMVAIDYYELCLLIMIKKLIVWSVNHNYNMMMMMMMRFNSIMIKVNLVLGGKVIHETKFQKLIDKFNRLQWFPRVIEFFSDFLRQRGCWRWRWRWRWRDDKIWLKF